MNPDGEKQSERIKRSGSKPAERPDSDRLDELMSVQRPKAEKAVRLTIEARPVDYREAFDKVNEAGLTSLANLALEKNPMSPALAHLAEQLRKVAPEAAESFTGVWREAKKEKPDAPSAPPTAKAVPKPRPHIPAGAANALAELHRLRRDMASRPIPQVAEARNENGEVKGDRLDAAVLIDAIVALPAAERLTLTQMAQKLSESAKLKALRQDAGDKKANRPSPVPPAKKR